MAHRDRSTPILIGALVILSGTAQGQPPPNVVESDGNANTAMGTEALISNTAGAANTAAGFRALTQNTTGDFNSAFGSFALASNSTGFQNTACRQHGDDS
jgi:hypothetical protein